MKPHNYQPPNTSLDVLYCDDYLIALNKPSGLLTVPGRLVEHRDSLATRVQQQYPTAITVHRLDMATSGVVVMALDKQSHRHLSRQFQDRETEKHYYAWVWGEVAQASGSIDLPLICDWPSRPLQKVDHVDGKQSLTYWYRLAVCNGNSLLKLVPHTGRSHQLRVHTQAIGHPILGDEFYAHKQALNAAPSLQLHGAELVITHPENGQRQSFSAPAPFSLAVNSERGECEQ